MIKTDTQLQEEKKKRTRLLIIASVAVSAVIMILPAAVVFSRAYFTYLFTKPEEHYIVEDYLLYRNGPYVREEYKVKWGMDETIWPEVITGDMDVQDYAMIRYAPFDAQFLGYLVVDYEEEPYAVERSRLETYNEECGRTDYIGIYGATGFEDYELLAMYADEENGFVYALTDGTKRIIYVEIIFKNYFMDLDYTQYIPEEYLPEGFDASPDNPYRAMMSTEE